MPYESKLNNAIEIFNDIIMLTCIYLCFLFSDFVPEPQMRYHIGKVFNFWVLSSIACNLLIYIYSVLANFKLLIRKIKDKCAKKKIQKAYLKYGDSFATDDYLQTNKLRRESFDSPLNCENDLSLTIKE